MSKKHCRSQDIPTKLRETDIFTSQGKTVTEAVRLLGISDVTYYRWRMEYGGITTSRANKRLQELE